MCWVALKYTLICDLRWDWYILHAEKIVVFQWQFLSKLKAQLLKCPQSTVDLFIYLFSMEIWRLSLVVVVKSGPVTLKPWESRWWYTTFISTLFTVFNFFPFDGLSKNIPIYLLSNHNAPFSLVSVLVMSTDKFKWSGFRWQFRDIALNASMFCFVF